MNFWRSLAQAYDDLYRSLRPAHGRLAELSAILCDGPSRTGHSPRDVLWARDDAHARAFEVRRLFGLPEVDESPSVPPQKVQKATVVETSTPESSEVSIIRGSNKRDRPREGLAEAVAAFDELDLFARATASSPAKTARISYELSGWAAAAVPITALLVAAYLLTRPPTSSGQTEAASKAPPTTIGASVVGAQDIAASGQRVQIDPGRGPTTTTITKVDEQLYLRMPAAAEATVPHKELEKAAVSTLPVPEVRGRPATTPVVTPSPREPGGTVEMRGVASRRAARTPKDNRSPPAKVEPPINWSLIE